MRVRIGRLAIAAAVVSLATLGAVASSASAQTATTSSLAKRAPQVQICASQNTDHCLNRYHGTTGFGTWVVSYHRGDANNDFSFAIENVSWCGNSTWVHNGENGLVCPFTNGSGLNARYDHKFVYFIHAYGETNTCAAVNDFSLTAVNLEPCGSTGYLWVISPNGSQGGYLINVGMSNFEYSQGGGSNRPYWLYDLGIGNRLVVSPSNPDVNTLWGCAGSGIDEC